MNDSKYFPLVTALFVSLLVISNIVAVKIIAVSTFFLPAAIVVFPLTYVIGDVVTEVYGYAAIRRMIWTGFLCNLVAVLFFQITIALPSAPFWTMQESYGMIFGAAPRILFGSFIGYLAGGFSNALIMSKMKVWMGGRLLPIRTITSTIVGEGLDSLLFITFAFAGVIPQPALFITILAQWIIKTLIEVVITPLTVMVVSFLKRRETMDAYDRDVSFSPLHF